MSEELRKSYLDALADVLAHMDQRRACILLTFASRLIWLP